MFKLPGEKDRRALRWEIRVWKNNLNRGTHLFILKWEHIYFKAPPTVSGTARFRTYPCLSPHTIKFMFSLLSSASLTHVGNVVLRYIYVVTVKLQYVGSLVDSLCVYLFHFHMILLLFSGTTCIPASTRKYFSLFLNQNVLCKGFSC